MVYVVRHISHWWMEVCDPFVCSKL